MIVSQAHTIGIKEFLGTDTEGQVVRLAVQDFGYLVRASGPFMQFKRVSFQSSTVSSAMGLKSIAPALFTITLGVPNCSATSISALTTVASSPMSKAALYASGAPAFRAASAPLLVFSIL